MSYSVTWQAGPSAQIELFSPDVTDGRAENTSYRIKFSPPMRKTLRPPLSELILNEGDLDPINRNLNALMAVADGRGNPGNAANEGPGVIQRAREIGNILHNLVIPNDVQAELSAGNLFVEFGVDERLLEYPWELLYDGVDFLGCRHGLGRFVNLTRPSIPNVARPALPDNGPLSVLIISVPLPVPRGNPPVQYAPLPGAQNETAAIAAVLSLPNIDLTILSDAQATFNNVLDLFNARDRRFHIIHYNGHAYFNRNSPRRSSLVLQDQDMNTAFIQNLLSRKPPLFFFVNGCETAMAQGGTSWKDRYDIFGLARAFLDTGAYFLGTRWSVGDSMAALFAKTFYEKLLEGTPLGIAVRDARRVTFDAAVKNSPDDFSWASYVYYGDPRLVICRNP